MNIANLEEYSQLDELPVRFKHVADKGHLKHAPASQEQLQQIEKEALLSAFSFQKFCGVAVKVREKRDIVMEFNASVKHHYFEPSYMRFRKESGSSGYSIVKYFLPDSINVKTMVKSLPLTGDKELVKFVQAVQLGVEAYHDRKQQILLAKDILRSKEVKFFNSTDYMFVVLTLKMPDKVKEFVSVDISLIYEFNRVRPSSIEPKCKDIDKETLSAVKEEFSILKTQSLDEGLHILFSKQESGSETSSFSKISSVNEEPEQHNLKNETRNVGLNLSSDSRRNIKHSSQKGSNLRSRRSLSRSPTKAAVHKHSSPERKESIKSKQSNRSPIKDITFKSEKVAHKKKKKMQT